MTSRRLMTVFVISACSVLTKFAWKKCYGKIKLMTCLQSFDGSVCCWFEGRARKVGMIFVVVRSASSRIEAIAKAQDCQACRETKAEGEEDSVLYPIR